MHRCQELHFRDCAGVKLGLSEDNADMNYTPLVCFFRRKMVDKWYSMVHIVQL
jgi:hypothetical protein